MPKLIDILKEIVVKTPNRFPLSLEDYKKVLFNFTKTMSDDLNDGIPPEDQDPRWQNDFFNRFEEELKNASDVKGVNEVAKKFLDEYGFDGDEEFLHILMHIFVRNK